MGAIAIIAAALIFVVVVGDIILAIFSARKTYRNEAITWSQLLRESYGVTIVITWAISVWIGRWFSPLNESLLKFIYSFIIVLSITLVLLLLGILLSRRYRRPVIPPIVIVLLGLVCGAVLLPLTPVL